MCFGFKCPGIRRYITRLPAIEPVDFCPDPQLVNPVQARYTSPDLNAERFERKYTFGCIGAVPGQHRNRQQGPGGEPGQQAGKQGSEQHFIRASDCAIAQHAVLLAGRPYSGDDQRFIESGGVKPDPAFATAVSAHQVVIKVMGHGQAFGRAPIDTGSELITMKVYFFEFGYYAVRIKQLRHTKHPV